MLMRFGKLSLSAGNPERQRAEGWAFWPVRSSLAEGWEQPNRVRVLWRYQGGIFYHFTAHHESRFEEIFHPGQYFRSGFRLISLFAKGGATRYSVGEPRGELLHLSGRIRQF